MDFLKILQEFRGDNSCAWVARKISSKLAEDTVMNWFSGRNSPPEWAQDLIVMRVRAIERHVKPDERHTKWHRVDWSQPNTEIARALGVGKGHASKMRALLAPETVLQGRATAKRVDWAGVDWSKDDAALATMLGVQRSSVRTMRLRRQKFEPRRKPRRIVLWETADWSQTNGSIAKTLGVSPGAVYHRRKKKESKNA